MKFLIKGDCNKYLGAVFHLILRVNLLVLSIESYPSFDITAQMYKVLQYQKMGMIQCLKLKDILSKSSEKPLRDTYYNHTYFLAILMMTNRRTDRFNSFLFNIGHW